MIRLNTVLRAPGFTFAIALLTSCFLFTPNALAIDSLSVQDVLTKVISYSPAVKQASRLVRATKANVGEQRAGYFPCLSATGIYSRLEPVSSFTPVGGQAPVAIFPIDNYDAHATVQQSFTFWRTSAAVRQAESAQRSSGWRRDALVQQQQFAVLRSYYSLKYYQQLLTEIESQAAALNTHLRYTEHNEKTGTATSYSVITSRVQIASLESQKIETAAQLRNAAVSLSELTGLAVNDTVHLEELPAITAINRPVDSLIATALHTNPAIRLAEEEITGTQNALQLSENNYLPSINANLTAGWKNGYLPNVNTLQPNWSIGAQINVPIFCGLRNFYADRAAHEDELAAVEKTQDTELRLRTNVRQSVINLNAATALVKASEPRVKQADDALSIAQVNYAAGVVTDLDILDAYQEVSLAKIDRLNARFQALQSYLSLKEALGEVP